MYHYYQYKSRNLLTISNYSIYKKKLTFLGHFVYTTT